MGKKKESELLDFALIGVIAVAGMVLFVRFF